MVTKLLEGLSNVLTHYIGPIFVYQLRLKGELGRNVGRVWFVEYDWLVYLSKEREFSVVILQAMRAAITFDRANCSQCFYIHTTFLT